MDAQTAGSWLVDLAKKSWDVNHDVFLSSFDQLRGVNENVLINWHDVDVAKFEASPYEYIQELYDIRELMYHSLSKSEWETRVLNALFLKYLQRQVMTGDFESIPSLNHHSVSKVKNGQIVSFRCMIQDELGLEYGSIEYTSIDRESGEIKRRTTLLKDYSFQDNEVGSSILTEKEVYVAVSPPADNFWVSQETEDPELSAMKKAKLDEIGEDNDLVGLPDYSNMFPEIFNKIGETKPMACILKIYKYGDAVHKVTDMLQITGLIQLPEPESELEKDCETTSKLLARLPVLHVFSAVPLVVGNPKVLWLDKKAFPLFEVNSIDVMECAEVLRDLFALGLGGDRYAAAYAMIALVAKLHILDKEVSPESKTVGRCILNVSGIPSPSDIPDLFLYILKSLVPGTCRFDYNVEKVNSTKFTPTKNVETNILETGLFQLPEDTHFIIDETKLGEGEFTEAGCRNLTALRDILAIHEVRYNYTYQMPIVRANFPTIILSTCRSTLVSDVHVRIKIDEKITTEERRKRIEHLLQEKGEMLRNYIALVQYLTMHSRYGIADGLNEEVVAYFVTRNKSDMFNNKMKPNEFSAFVTSCRLWSLLHGHAEELTRDSFMYVKELERIRDNRIEKYLVP